MKTIMLEIPDDASQWAAWMDQRMISLDLGTLVAELVVTIADPPLRERSLDEVCGGKLNRLIERGFHALESEEIGELLCRPKLLLELQERILIENPPYWRTVPRSSDFTDSLSSVRDKMSRLMESGQLEDDALSGSHASSTVPESKMQLVTRQKPSSRMRFLAGVGLIGTLAASVLIGLGIWGSLTRGQPWGFDRPGLLASKHKPSECFVQLADSAEDWFDVRPIQASKLDQRFAEFEHGCQSVIAAPYPQLPTKDREWLIGKCKDWLVVMAEHRDRLKQGDKLEEVLARADATIRKLQAALRDRGKTLG